MDRINLLLTGSLDRGVWDVVSLLESDCSVTVAGSGIHPDNEKHRKKYFDISENMSDLALLYKSGHFQTVVFFYSFKSERSESSFEDCGRLGALVDELKSNLALVREHTEVAQFILVTDQRVFGDKQDKSEYVNPSPDSSEGRLIALAENELNCFEGRGNRLKKLILRTTHLFHPGGIGEFIADFNPRMSHDRLTAFLPGRAVKLCNFISASDLARLLLIAVSRQTSGILHACGIGNPSYEAFAGWLQTFGIGAVFSGVYERAAVLSGTRAYSELGWTACDRISDCIRADAPEHKKQNLIKSAYGYIKKKLGRLLPWLETLIGAGLMQLLVSFTSSNAVYRFIDVRLLFAVLIGSVHGSFFGWIAGIIATVSYCAAYLSSGTGTLWDFLLNMDNWLPLILYLIAGGITGYVKSLHDNDTRELKEALARKTEDLEYLRGVHQYTCDMRDTLMEQVIKSRDSYGKVFAMVSELNSMYPDEVFFHALGIFEDMLANRSITFYIRENRGHYIRKLVESQNMRETPFSLRLDDYDGIMKSADSYTLYTNTVFQPDMPVYVMSMKLSERYDFIIILWKADSSQYSKYYRNLIVIISQLTRISLERAISFQLSPERYVDGTRLLKQDEFIRSWQLRRKMRADQVGRYVLFRFSAALPDGVLCERLYNIVRTLDIAGKMDDGSRYILMMQADVNDIPVIIKRFISRGISADQANERELDSYVKQV